MITEPTEWNESTKERFQEVGFKIEEACKNTVDATSEKGMRDFDADWYVNHNFFFRSYSNFVEYFRM